MNNGPLRVLIVVEPGLNGVFRHAEGLCDYLLRQPDVRVSLAYSDVRISDALEPLVDRVRAGGGLVVNLRVNSAPAVGDLRATWALIDVAVRFRAQVIHGHSSKAGGLARAAWFLGLDAAQFYTPHAYFGLNKVGGIKIKFFNGLEMALARAGRTINVSSSEGRFAKDRLFIPTGSLLTIPNAVDCGRFYPPSADERVALRQGLGIPEQAWVFGTVGRYGEQKDPLTLYRAVEQVLQADPGAWFAHLGEGELFDEVTEFIQGKPWTSRVVRVRYSSQPAAFYRALDAFVLSSRYEGLPISGIEALATGLPLVLTLCPGCTDFASMGLDGVAWGAVERPDTLATGLRAVRDLKPFQINHRAVAERRFSPTAVYGEILKAYRAAVGEGDKVVV